MQLDDGFANRQAQSCSTPNSGGRRVSLLKGLEYALLIFWRNAGAGIGHPNDEIFL
jgi:hypothetical protein